MEVMDAIRNRHSVRSYQEKPIEEDKLRRILDAGRLAPSANNMQEWRFVVVRDAKTRQKLMKAAKGQTFVGQAPVVIAACATEVEYVMTCGHHCYPIDLAIAVDHITLAAVDEGLGTCWIGAFYEDEVKKLLGVPDELRVPILLALGYPADTPGPKSRKSFEEVVAFERFA